jgi:hypothetical protein
MKSKNLATLHLYRPADKIVFTDYRELASKIGSPQHDDDDDDSVQDRKVT